MAGMNPAATVEIVLTASGCWTAERAVLTTGAVVWVKRVKRENNGGEKYDDNCAHMIPPNDDGQYAPLQ